MTGCFNTDPNELVPNGLVFESTSGTLMIVGFVVFNNTLSVVVRNMNSGRISDCSYGQVVEVFQEYQKVPLWT